MQQVAPLFDHFVCAGEQRWRHVDPERLRGLEINCELILGRGLYRKVARLLALEEDAIDIAGCASILVVEIRAVGGVHRNKKGRRSRPRISAWTRAPTHCATTSLSKKQNLTVFGGSPTRGSHEIAFRNSVRWPSRLVAPTAESAALIKV